MSKMCRYCFIEKSVTCFSVKNSAKDRLQTNCKDCCKKRRAINKPKKKLWAKQYYEKTKHLVKDKNENTRLLRKYGISKSDYNYIAEGQNFQCLICTKVEKLCVDHCHKNGHVRGLLCADCNLALGLFKDNTKSLINAVKYLKNISTFTEDTYK